MKFVPMIGSPPMPMRRRLADAARRQLLHGLVGQRARAGDDADVAFA